MIEKDENACFCCGKHTDNEKDIRVSEDDGFMQSSYSVRICDDCQEKQTFLLSNGACFLKVNDKLYCQYGPYGNFELITSDADIEKVFNPERYHFRKWLNKVV